MWFLRKNLPEKLLQNPYCRLESMAEIEMAAALGMRIDVNQASVDDWLRLPGISIHQARSLVELIGMGVQLLCLEDLAAALSMPVGRVKPWEPVLDFSYYDPASMLTPHKINPNTASKQELAEIPLLNLTIASMIVENRIENGVYLNLADLQRRLGFSSDLISQLLHYLKF
ncbi:MAG: ComEA family DNA-binding protein [Gomphosphaeria aponina SAG 52.96 = DSM 107014]|uniref:ComEA family DNA-binding protein n=1 Tax=Gomphosphaeria aponina SAG 52.96 = DSM 107014 TaxID=1521640 RepID=A0A941GQV1_9CHRO|nr:ComEA family DNA-binding protein [Gomphosphaeria aponina SAG 52.96 = DSM 107014]